MILEAISSYLSSLGGTNASDDTLSADNLINCGLNLFMHFFD